MNNPYAYYSMHMNSPLSYAGSRRETEIEYIVRVAREKQAAEKAERRRAQIALVKAMFRSVLNGMGYGRAVSPQTGH